jgi:formylglycine-generating enzyme required for sulfatase activity
VFPAGEFLMGSPESELHRETGEPLHRRQIERPFAIAATEVTRAQYLAFITATGASDSTNRYVKSLDSPQTGMEWFEAARYCNWLSEQDGIEPDQWCFEPNAQGEYGPGMKTREVFLDLAGYRLPTEAEWEYACRAGTTTGRYFGSSESRLGEFAWYFSNSDDRTHPVGERKPNDAGLFDMLGNAFEWCHDAYAYGYPTSQGALPTLTDRSANMDASLSRVLRGGSFNFPSSFVRAALRFDFRPGDNILYVSFRPARTYR